MFEKIICSISSTLERCNIPYMLIGGQAVLIYGEPRLTRDIDITLGVDVDKIEDVISVANEPGWPPKIPHLWPLENPPPSGCF